MTRKAKRTSPAKAFLKFLCTLLGLILILLVAGTYCFQHGQTTEALPQDLLDTYLPNLSLPSLPLPAASSETEAIGGKGSGIVNILLIGSDRREGETRARSDSIILCTFHKKEKTLTMTSFLRDLYVAIPGHGSNRINAAYAFGGAELLNETLEENFGLHIDGNVEVDFSQFSQIIDLLGGVELELRQDEADLLNKELGASLTSGTQRLSGEQALLYARIRKLDADGDFSRTSRQRKVLSSLLESYKSKDPAAMVSLATKLMPMIDTDLNTFRLLGYAVELYPVLSDGQLISQHIPATGDYTNQTIDGMAVLVPDLDAAREMLKATLLEE